MMRVFPQTVRQVIALVAALCLTAPGISTAGEETFEVKLLETGPDCQTVDYRMNYKICNSSATYKKTLDTADHAVRFTMLKHRVSGWGIPVMTSSSGSYTITDNDDARMVTYEQSVTLQNKIGALDWAMIQRKTKDFFTDFDTYIRQQEALRAKQQPASE